MLDTLSDHKAKQNEESMLKFFRIVRQNLTAKGKLKNYILYAVGEIFLVVVGILLAISLNNLNQAKIAENDLQKKVQKIREEVYQDSLLFEHIIEYNNQKIETIERMASLIEENISYDDYLQLIEFLNRESGRTRTFSPKSQTYTGLTTSGEFSKIKNDSLKNKVAFLYSYYEHMSKINYSTIENLQSYRQKLFSNGILSAKYINEEKKQSEEGFLYMKKKLSDPNQKVIFENYLYLEKEMCELVTKRCHQIFGAMHGLPLRPLKK